jgi:hypothetical protein
MANTKTWIITTGGSRPIGDIAKDLGAAGLVGGQVLEAIGCITGSAGDKAVAKLRKIPGVVDVSPDPSVGIGPPDAPETW